MRVALVLAAALALLAGCDLPTDPVPSNPYDPLFDGPRIPTSPDSLRLTASTTTSISLAWEDRSSFETAVVVQRSTSATGGGFATIATLPPDATSYTDATITDTRERRYRIVAVSDGEQPAAPSDPIRLQYRNTTLRLSGVGDVPSRGVFSRTGETLYAIGASGVFAVETRSGASLGRLNGAAAVVGDLGGEGVATVSSTVGPTARVQIYDHTAPGALTVLTAGGACLGVAPTTVRVSDDGQTFVAICTEAAGGPSIIGVWTGAGAPARTVALPAGRALSVELSRSGTRAVVAAAPATGTGREVSGLDVAAGTVRWSYRDGAAPTLAPRFSPDGATLLDAEFQTVRLRAADSGAIVVSSPVGAFAAAEELSFSPDGRAVGILYGLSGTVVVAQTADLSLTLRLDQIRASGTRLIDAAGGVVAFRTAGPDADLIRFEAGQNWIVVP